MIDETDITCPYCGESFTTVVDCSAGDQEYIEDCFVCCRPIVFVIGVSAEGVLETVQVKTENE